MKKQNLSVLIKMDTYTEDFNSSPIVQSGLLYKILLTGKYW